MLLLTWEKCWDGTSAPIGFLFWNVKINIKKVNEPSLLFCGVLVMEWMSISGLETWAGPGNEARKHTQHTAWFVLLQVQWSWLPYYVAGSYFIHVWLLYIWGWLLFFSARSKCGYYLNKYSTLHTSCPAEIQSLDLSRTFETASLIVCTCVCECVSEWRCVWVWVCVCACVCVSAWVHV